VCELRKQSRVILDTRKVRSTEWNRLGVGLFLIEQPDDQSGRCYPEAIWEPTRANTLVCIGLAAHSHCLTDFEERTFASSVQNLDVAVFLY
jgi:hypothetical protein